MMDTGDELPGPVNIGNPGEFSMLELADKVIELTGSKSKLVRMPLPADDPKQRRPDISLAQKELGGWAAQDPARGRPEEDHRLLRPDPLGTHRGLSS